MDQTSVHSDVVFLAHFLTLSLTISHLVMQSDGRYLRPAEHGFAYQNSTTPTRDDVPQMLSFFNGGKPASSLSNLPLPEARNFTSTGAENNDWWNRRIRSRDDSSRDHLKGILLVASLVCGLAGVIFLVVSGIIFLFRCRQQRSFPEPSPTPTLALTGGAVSCTNKL